MAEPLLVEGPSGSWPPSGLPHDARVFQLKSNSKEPPPGFMGAHHRAKPLTEALVVICPKLSYGMSLDEQFVLVDRDSNSEQALAAQAALPATWAQKTWSDKIHLIYRTPKDFVGHNVKWLAADGSVLGDLKCHGYAVGPGSTVNDNLYRLLDGRDPIPAPPEILNALAAAPGPPPETQYDQIPYQQRDHIMHKLGSLLRRYGVSERGIYEAYTAIRKSPAMEQPFGFEWTDGDAKRNAHSAAQYTPETMMGTLVPESVLLARDTPLVGLPKRWWMRGFVARNALHLLYGDGECGKSTFGSYLYGNVTAQGGRALFVGTEEPWENFGRRAVNGGGNRDLMYYLDRGQASRLIFPKHAEDLANIVAVLGVDFIYFDSIMSHTDPSDRGSAPERDRRMLAALSAIETTIVGIFHERRGDGEWSGSNERKNVPRILLHAQRNVDSDEPMDLMVKKSNLRPKPKYVATFVGHEKLALDPEDGKQQFEEDETGKLVPSFDLIVERGPDKPIGKKGKGKSSKVTGSVNLGDVEMEVSVASD